MQKLRFGVMGIAKIAREKVIPPLQKAMRCEVVAIASSDADFLPLAIRLREAGAWVICFAQREKAAQDELQRGYDELILVDDSGVAEAPRPVVAESRVRTPTTSRSRRAPAKAAAPVVAAPPEPAEDLKRTIEQLLRTIPGLREGKTVELNEVVTRLKDASVLGKRASGPRFLQEHAPYLTLSPARQPNKVRWTPVR